MVHDVLFGFVELVLAEWITEFLVQEGIDYIDSFLDCLYSARCGVCFVRFGGSHIHLIDSPQHHASCKCPDPPTSTPHRRRPAYPSRASPHPRLLIEPTLYPYRRLLERCVTKYSSQLLIATTRDQHACSIITCLRSWCSGVAGRPAQRRCLRPCCA